VSQGLGVLFGKLQQGVRENDQIVTIARMRADAEDLYGQHLGDILPATDRITNGFQRDDGASTKKVSIGINARRMEAHSPDRHTMECAQRWRKLQESIAK
jgi:hypothetical protein